MYFVKNLSLVAGLVLAISLAPFMSSQSVSSEESPLGLEIVIFEITDCSHCDFFRNRVARVYQDTEYAERVPLRVVDLDAMGTHGYPLRSEITAAPTIVVFHEGREVQRFGGALAPDRFFALVEWMIDIYG